MKMCRRCRKGQKEQGGYLRGTKIVRQTECSIHPRMDNWRVARTVKTLIAWGLDGKGSTIAVGASGNLHVQRVVVGLGNGWIHLRNAKLKLFDYEVPFLDLLLKEGMIERRECKRGLLEVSPIAVRVTMRGHTWIKELELRHEAEQKVDVHVEQEKLAAGL